VKRTGPLDNPRLRIERAGQHLANLKRRVKTYQDANEGTMLYRIDQSGALTVQGLPKEAPPRIIGVLLGETIQNLRTALDYLVFALAWWDSGKFDSERKTQFPICDSLELFKSKRDVWLAGISDDHRIAIEWLQPYKGRKWLANLRDISNLDKHNIVTVTPGLVGTAVVPVGLPDLYVKAAGGFKKPGDDAVYYKAPLVVTFSKGPPVINVVEVFKAEVSAIVDAFEPEFEGWEARVPEPTVSAELLIRGPLGEAGQEPASFRASMKPRSANPETE